MTDERLQELGGIVIDDKESNAVLHLGRLVEAETLREAAEECRKKAAEIRSTNQRFGTESAYMWDGFADWLNARAKAVKP